MRASPYDLRALGFVRQARPHADPAKRDTECEYSIRLADNRWSINGGPKQVEQLYTRELLEQAFADADAPSDPTAAISPSRITTV